MDSGTALDLCENVAETLRGARLLILCHSRGVDRAVCRQCRQTCVTGRRSSVRVKDANGA